MSESCGCTPATCGCCEGTEKLTPARTDNPPGLSALRYRAGTHGSFLETMKAELAVLPGLTTRDTGDPSLALLDGWATVGDVLTFYQERIANEGFLRSASERRSVLELARLVGYRLRPGVSATTYLAYTIDDTQLDPVDIPGGARAQSVPGPDELPQSFETSEKLTARSAWNNLQVRLRRPQLITLDNVLEIERIYVTGTATGLKPGDSLLFRFGANVSALRTVAGIEPHFDPDFTQVNLRAATPIRIGALAILRRVAGTLATIASTGAGIALGNARGMITSLLLGVDLPVPFIIHELGRAAGDIQLPAVEAALNELSPSASPPKGPVTSRPDRFIRDLLKPPLPQARNSLELGRGLARSFEPGGDAHAQLLVNLARKLKETYYVAWANTVPETRAPALQGVYALREVAPLFGSNAPKQATYYTEADHGTHRPGEIKPADQWTDWDLDGDETEAGLFLDKAYEGIAPDGYLVIQQGPTKREVRQIQGLGTLQRNAYGQSGKTTRLAFREPWWNGAKDSMATLRQTLVYGQSELLDLFDEPMSPEEVSGSEIPLAGLYDELTSGRWVIFSGERADIPGVRGVRVSELLMIAGVRHGYDHELPGDKTHTTLTLATPTAFNYLRNTLVIYGNVVKATHGETRAETLGAGDATQSLQTFALKQPPVTYVPAPNPSGVDSTLKVYVNDVEWPEAETLTFLGPRDRRFTTRTDDDGKAAVVFGTGSRGARLPTGVENVRAVYRSGIGKPGNVRAGQVTLLQNKPLGVKEVVNPLAGSGGADREDRDQARENAPLAVMALDRLVSVQDYADFTRSFAGIGKARAAQLSDGHRELVHVTIAGADDIPIEPVSDLYRNLVTALWQLGDPGFPIQVESRELLVLVLSANLRIETGYLWDKVVIAVRARLLDQFGFGKRSLGQPALLSEAISAIQGVRGVAYVDVDGFGGIPEKKSDADDGRRLLTQDEMADAVQAVAASARPAQRLDVNLAALENGVIRPAQLAIFTPAVPDTLILNQIL